MALTLSGTALAAGGMELYFQAKNRRLASNGTYITLQVAGTFHVPSAKCRSRHMECAYYFLKSVPLG